jgi:hypothetical protein
MSIKNSTSASHGTLASIPADLLHTAMGGAGPALLPNGEPNALLVGGQAPVSFPSNTLPNGEPNALLIGGPAPVSLPPFAPPRPVTAAQDRLSACAS